MSMISTIFLSIWNVLVYEIVVLMSLFNSSFIWSFWGLFLNFSKWDLAIFSVQFSSVAQSCPTLCNPHGLKHTRPHCHSPTPRVYSNSSPLSQWCHPAISSSVIPFSSCPQSFPASGSFEMSQLFASGGQSIGVSASTSVLQWILNEHFKERFQWSPLGWTGWISLQSKGLSRVFFNTTVRKHQSFGTQLSFVIL